MAPGPAAPRHDMRSAPKPTRLKRRAEFLRVAGKGRKTPVPGLVLQALARGDAEPARVGFTVTKKVGNAVVRNRTRRRLKAAASAVLAASPVQGVDLVLIGRNSRRADARSPPSSTICAGR